MDKKTNMLLRNIHLKAPFVSDYYNKLIHVSLSVCDHFEKSCVYNFFLMSLVLAGSALGVGRAEPGFQLYDF